MTVHNRKTGRDVLDDVSLAFHAGATHAVLVDAEDVEQHQALVATMVGMMRTTSGNVMHKSTNLADATPVDVLGHRIGFIPQRSPCAATLMRKATCCTPWTRRTAISCSPSR